MIDPRLDPRYSKSSKDFWYGYGLYLEGTRHQDVPDNAEMQAGYCYAMIDGKQPAVKKPWWQSRTIWLGGLTFAMSIVGAVYSNVIAENPQATGIVAAAAAASVVYLRSVTSTSLGKNNDR